MAADFDSEPKRSCDEENVQHNTPLSADPGCLPKPVLFKIRAESLPFRSNPSEHTRIYPSPMSTRTSSSALVVLNVYKLDSFAPYENYLKYLFLGAYHTGVEVYGEEISFVLLPKTAAVSTIF